MPDTPIPDPLIKDTPAKETSQTIQEWGNATFGEAASVLAYARRAQEELDELIEAIQNQDTEADMIAEAADVTILLHRLVGTLGADLSEAVDRKMAINRQRIWKQSGDGVGQHV